MFTLKVFAETVEQTSARDSIVEANVGKENRLEEPWAHIVR